MKTIKTFGAVGSALAISGVLAFSGQAVADTVIADLDLDGARGGNINFTGGNGSAGLFNASAQGGSFTTDLLPFGDSFVAFCLEPQQALGGGNTTYTVKALAEAPSPGPGSPMGSGGQTALEILLGNVYPVFGAGDVQNATETNLTRDESFIALQAAIWEISSERNTNVPYSVSTGDFKVTGGQGDDTRIVNQANAWLSSLNGGAWQANQLGNLVALVNGDEQDFVGQVPIPAAAWLFGSAMVGAVALGRRKSKKQAQAQV